jgi:DNA polymerase (family X)
MRPTPLGRAYDTLTAVQALIAFHCPAFDQVQIAGGARRFEPLVHDLILVGRTFDAAEAVGELATTPGIADVRSPEPGVAIISFQQTELVVRCAVPDEFGSALFTATGSPQHVAAVAGGDALIEPCSSERDLYERSGLRWIPPEIRHASGEIEAAATGVLPLLVERADIRGDLHMHSTYSDGQDTLEVMMSAAATLGYEYVAITDHSTSAAASRAVTLDQLASQHEEVERLRETFPQMAILHGIEVEILSDGRLDFDDSILERLDIVLASLHDAAGQDGPALTRRCIDVMRHPLVNVITHPANQLVGRRPGYPMDYEALYAAAVETGTALEIDGAPSHLDLDGEHARAAVAAGVTVTIDSDCHRAGALERQMFLGIGTARRGWVEARHVLNTRPLAAVREFVKAKRRGKV